MPKRWTYIIAYDTPSDPRRAKMLERIQGFGLGPQLSFYECELSPGERGELWRELRACTDKREDKLLLLRLDPRSEKWRLAPQKTERAKTRPVTYVG